MNKVGPMFLLFLLFLGLKLAGVIDWSWWWITAPLWGGIAVWIAIIAAILVVAGMTGIIAAVVLFFEHNRKQK